MTAYFMPIRKSNEDELKKEYEILNANPLSNALIQSTGHMVTILNRNRHIISTNQSMIENLDFKSTEDVFGFRLGKAFNCIHADNNSGGCGTTKYCLSCGAAMAIASAEANNYSVEKIYALETNKNGKLRENCFKIQAIPFKDQETSFILLLLDDTTKTHRLAALEEVFYHDINKTLYDLVEASEDLDLEIKNRGTMINILNLVDRLQENVKIQQILTSTQSNTDNLSITKFNINDLLAELKIFAKEICGLINFKFEHFDTNLILDSDYSIIIKILKEMLKNAFEASSVEDTVKIFFKNHNNSLIFSVWNNNHIPSDIQLRIFHKHFSTKKGDEHGLGTYSMKLLGEQLLKGKVNFTSSIEEGTTFSFVLPHADNP